MFIKHRPGRALNIVECSVVLGGLYLLIKFMLKKEKKTAIIKEHSINEKDTGSSDVQIGLLSEEIEALVGHLKDHPKDVHSKRGLIRMVIKRKKLLAYLKKDNEKRYKEIIKKIGFKK